MTRDRDREPGLTEQHSDGRLVPRLSLCAWLAVAAFLLLAPLFAHGCHGDDVDHEPLLIPIRLNVDDR